VGGRKDLLRDSLIVCFLYCSEVMCTGEYIVDDSIWLIPWMLPKMDWVSDALVICEPTPCIGGMKQLV
jgi:hypothetical protein